MTIILSTMNAPSNSTTLYAAQCCADKVLELNVRAIYVKDWTFSRKVCNQPCRGTTGRRVLVMCHSFALLICSLGEYNYRSRHRWRGTETVLRRARKQTSLKCDLFHALRSSARHRQVEGRCQTCARRRRIWLRNFSSRNVLKRI